MPSSEEVVFDGLVWKVMTFKHGYNQKLLSRTYKCLTSYLSKFSKVLMIRFDLSLYDVPPDNKLVAKYFKHLKNHLSNYYKSQIGYGWVREQGHENNRTHYHCFVLLNGQKANRTKKCFEFARQAQELLVDINVYFPDNPSYMVIRSNLQSIQAAFFRLSYLAKNETKDGKPVNTTSYSFSRALMLAS
ncbi:inovirus-type Gp2 protein [Shewanella sp. NIFS-20-20]|uniref:YagK/YfjJ domain-containing protein n=1 Tax=Shewanella sp. NIFS-20-20 TaxID=2853806 RepID=UPI001C486EFD|nr:inovirus-type Gp2 protein [Shewanella sp. NIFS-20-20]MBV7317345.1 inovirus Gp2 family protein [Shewanella sp. NIFS-20-20]